jgi:hypothetical protein
MYLARMAGEEGMLQGIAIEETKGKVYVLGRDGECGGACCMASP